MCVFLGMNFSTKLSLNTLCQEVMSLGYADMLRTGAADWLKNRRWLNSSICNVTMAIGIPMFKILPSMIPGSLEGSFILKMRWATPGQLTLVNPLDDNALKWTLNKVALGLANSCEKRMGQRTGNINPCPLKFGGKGEKSRLQWHQICLPVSFRFTSQKLWALSSLKSNISLAAQLECLGRRYALVCQQVHAGVYLATAWRLKVPIWVTRAQAMCPKLTG